MNPQPASLLTTGATTHFHCTLVLTIPGNECTWGWMKHAGICNDSKQSMISILDRLGSQRPELSPLAIALINDAVRSTSAAEATDVPEPFAIHLALDYELECRNLVISHRPIHLAHDYELAALWTSQISRSMFLGQTLTKYYDFAA